MFYYFLKLFLLFILSIIYLFIELKSVFYLIFSYIYI